jgi:hypothetical protein
MNSRYIDVLRRRHAGIERQIEDEQKSPCPDALRIMRLRKIRQQYRDQMKAAISQKRIAINRNQQPRFPNASARLAQVVNTYSNGGA